MISSAGKFHFAAGGIVDGFCQTLTVSPSAWLDEKGTISVDTLSRGEKTELNLHCALPGQDDRCLIRIPQQRTCLSLPAHKCVCPFRILRDTPMRL